MLYPTEAPISNFVDVLNYTRTNRTYFNTLVTRSIEKLDVITQSTLLCHHPRLPMMTSGSAAWPDAISCGWTYASNGNSTVFWFTIRRVF